MKTLKQLIADIQAINEEFSAAPDETLDKPGFTKAETKFLAAIGKAEVALAQYRPRTPVELVQKVAAMIEIDHDAFNISSAMKVWRKTLLRDVTMLLPDSQKRAA